MENKIITREIKKQTYIGICGRCGRIHESNNTEFLCGIGQQWVEMEFNEYYGDWKRVYVKNKKTEQTKEKIGLY